MIFKGQRWNAGISLLPGYEVRSSRTIKATKIDCDWKRIATNEKRRSKSFHLLLKENMNAALPRYVYTHPQQLSLYFKPHLS